MKNYKIITILLCMLLASIAVLTMFILKNEKLIIENDSLKEQIRDYKWQLEQVPYIIEYGCRGE